MSRLTRGLSEYQKFKRRKLSVKILVSGKYHGNTPKKPEAIIMKSWLIDNGVPKSDIIAETKSTNTI